MQWLFVSEFCTEMPYIRLLIDDTWIAWTCDLWFSVAETQYSVARLIVNIGILKNRIIAQTTQVSCVWKRLSKKVSPNFYDPYFPVVLLYSSTKRYCVQSAILHKQEKKYNVWGHSIREIINVGIIIAKQGIRMHGHKFLLKLQNWNQYCVRAHSATFQVWQHTQWY